MANWLFLEDYDPNQEFDPVINLEFVTTILLRPKDSQIVIFFGGSHVDPHLLSYGSPEEARAAHDKLKQALRQQCMGGSV